MILQPCKGEGDNEQDDGEQSLKGNQILEISMNSVVGLNGNQTMKLMGKLIGEEILVLIDSGATHNFIATEVTLQDIRSITG